MTVAYQEVVPVAESMLKRYSMCNYCLGRLFARQLRRVSDGATGRKIREIVAETPAGKEERETPAVYGQIDAKRCHICRGLFGGLDTLLRQMIDATEGYEFESFVIGATLKPSIIDRDDCMRSAYKLQGADGIKTGLTRELGRRFSRRSGSRQNRLEPEITLTMQPALGACTIRSKPVAVFGRYTKTARGMPQRQEPCTNCAGTGCTACRPYDASSYPKSVEDAISRILFESLGGTAVRFTWIGGEDRDSLVLGSGRPFFARIQNPKKRSISRACHSLGPIQLSSLQTVSTSTVRPIPFSSRVKIRVVADCPVGSGAESSSAYTIPLRSLKQIPKNITVTNRDGRHARKTVESLTYRRETADTFTITITTDGGVPIKRFVNGDGVSPNISEILGAPCRCEQFDFVDVWICK